MSARRHRLALAALVPFLALGLTACFGGGAGGSVEVGSAAPTSFTTAEWALEVEVHGDWLTSIANDDLRIDIYQVGITEAPEDSAWVYNDTEEPLFEAGDPIVVLQYVLTNTGDADVVLPSGTADTTATYAGLDLSSIPDESFAEVLESYGLSSDAPIDFMYANDHDYQGLTGSWDMPVAAGESVTWNEVFLYLEDDKLSLKFRIWPYADGEFDYAEPAFDSGKIALPFA